MARSTLEFRPEEFLAGQLRGWGMTHSRIGTLANQFRIEAKGEWDAARKTLHLRETYHFDDGHKDILDWSIVKGTGGHYIGTEPRLIGEAKGEQSGNWFRWRYKRRVPDKNGSESQLTFDDCFWMQDPSIVIARASVKKFGFEVAVITVVYQKA